MASRLSTQVSATTMRLSSGSRRPSWNDQIGLSGCDLIHDGRDCVRIHDFNNWWIVCGFRPRGCEGNRDRRWQPLKSASGQHRPFVDFGVMSGLAPPTDLRAESPQVAVGPEAAEYSCPLPARCGASFVKFAARHGGAMMQRARTMRSDWTDHRSSHTPSDGGDTRHTVQVLDHIIRQIELGRSEVLPQMRNR